MSRLDTYEIDPTWGCHTWTGHIDKRDGYALIWRGKSPVKAYLLTWQEANGPIPEGMTAEHRCRNRLCVRSTHLLIVTMSENLYRRRWDVRVKRPVCEAGHGAAETMVTPWGGRLCRVCHR